MSGNDQAQKQQLIFDAKDFLNGASRPPEAILTLAQNLIRFDIFGLARRVLDKAVEQNISDRQLKEKIANKRALATYKDTQLNPELALNRSNGILRESIDNKTVKDQETLGLAGAIYKRMWELDGARSNLELSLIYYERGYKAGIANDDGYTAINAAYVHDLLAHLEERQAQEIGVDAPTAAKHRKGAEKIRTAIVKLLADKLDGLSEQELEINYWPMATLMEAYFGLGDYEEAGKWLRKVKKIAAIPEWQIISTAKQLVQLVQYQAKPGVSEQELEKSPAWKLLLEFVGRKAYALRSMVRGKIGLALSGGGFRASLYHIGVLAKLAEYDLLRHIEVLSCVSGGSIIGAHYYLELRRLFHVEKNSDDSISRDDYIRLVETITDDFLAGVQQNPRVRLLANPWTNLKLLFSPGYSRTQRLGELYEELIYSRIKDGEGEKKRWLNHLYIYPEGNQDFLPRRDNWSRQCKIPELVLNATTLNTGHNWQFTVSWMGESPAAIDTDFDSNDRYRRFYYREAPDAYQNVRLGSAVGASSCVPGLFEPLILPGLYRDATVRLIDGGIFDN
ncbi:MAG: patatin-like phospholipase family protein, partial [Methylococcaceae bacterium]|nr:patatin-like phospholipase family protein [Methylococcaceae bacterium]